MTEYVKSALSRTNENIVRSQSSSTVSLQVWMTEETVAKEQHERGRN